jgi:arylsulfatase A-like enzyme
LSKSADNINVSGAFKTISSRRWQPLYAANTYISAASDSKKSDFTNQPTERKTKNTSNTWLKNTPSANSLVAELGIRIVNDEQLGQDNTPDMLLLQFSVRAPNEKFFSLQSVEKEDMYLRLDKEIQNLLQKIDTKVGMDKTLVYLFANQTEVHSPTELGDNNIPAGYFSANRSMALLNTYLMAMYGQERWVTGYYGKNIFLNKQKIEEKKLNFADFQKLVADFMPEFEGIQTAYPSSQILTMGGDSNSEIARLRNSTHKSSMGDVVITLMPGWLELDDDYKPVGESNALTSITPLFFYGMKLKPSKVNASYSVTDIAPTLSRILNIPLPNACIGKPIKEIFE